MNILITGGAGFIGSNLSAYFLQKNHQVTIIDNLITGSTENIKLFLNNAHFRFIKEDLVNFNFEDLKIFNLIYHLASPASPEKYKQYPIETMMVNSQGTKKILDFFKSSQSQTFVFASTSEVYGDPLIHPQTEDYWGNVNCTGLRSCYDEAKRFAEALIMTYLRQFHLDVRIARIFNTYGPSMEKDDGRVVSNFITQALSGSPITVYGTGDQTRSFCYISDMVKALYLLGTLQIKKGEIVNLGNTEEMKVKDLARLIINLTQTRSKIVFNAIDADDPKKRKPNITKAQTLLGWRPEVKLKDGLIKTIQYFKKIL